MKQSVGDESSLEIAVDHACCSWGLVTRMDRPSAGFLWTRCEIRSEDQASGMQLG
jgi:hypothetical protein